MENMLFNNGSLYGPMFSSGSITEHHSPLPPVSQFSHQISIHQQESPNEQQHTQQIASSSTLHQMQSAVTPYTVANHKTFAFFDAHDDRTPSPPTSDRSSPANGIAAPNFIYRGFSGRSFSCSNGMYE
ncbi:hypothetical protein KIN20_005208 [Parelaphostrongylus tenuis]|uniref:Uncharacterized protein n=1 Tax=Parelaphostrongylus tenuis TaxID=148309 RepID=A0AAD5QHB4_PARTN|nr:hypothetical protein KIN20_005208 [Parelaphostrongylus tenuis]